MALIDGEKAAKALVDEAAVKLEPQLEAAIESGVTKLIEGLRGLLVGRTITIKLFGFPISIKID